MDVKWGFALHLPCGKLVRGKGPGQGQGWTIEIWGALVASADPVKHTGLFEISLPSAFVGLGKNEPLCWGMCWTLCRGRAEAEQVSDVPSTSPSSQATFLEMLPNPLSPLGLTWLSQPEPRCRWPSLFLLRCAWGWEKSDLMELFLRKDVDVIFFLDVYSAGKLVEVQTTFPEVLGMCDVQHDHRSCPAWSLQPQQEMPKGAAGP